MFPDQAEIIGKQLERMEQAWMYMKALIPAWLEHMKSSRHGEWQPGRLPEPELGNGAFIRVMVPAF